MADVRLDAPGDLASVARVLYLMFTEGYGGAVDLAVEAIRLARQLAEQDRSLWRTDLVVEGVSILQRALARDRLGQYQAQAAIAALHADATSADQTDRVQICEWYDELVALTASPVHRLNRVVAFGEADGAAAGLAALDGIDPTIPRYSAVAAHLHERARHLQVARVHQEVRRQPTTATRQRRTEHAGLLP